MTMTAIPKPNEEALALHRARQEQARQPGPKWASHVVVDTKDGCVFRCDASGQLFDFDRATAFADERNAEMKPEHQSYQVFALVKAVHEWPPRKTCGCGEAWADEPGHGDH